MLRLLLDTNLLIHLEDPKELMPELQALRQIIRQNGHQEVIHPASKQDILRDKDETRRKLLLSKLGGYPEVEPLSLTPEFVAQVGASSDENDAVDNALLFSLFQNQVNFLISEDQGIYRKAVKLGIQDRVFSIASASSYFQQLHKKFTPAPISLPYGEVSNLNLADSFFDELKQDYSEFESWFKKIAASGRKGWYYVDEADALKVLMIIKEESDQPIPSNPPIPAGLRLKICTLKSDLPGFRIGELLLKIVFDYCRENGIPEVYLTHFEKENDKLVSLIQEFGFSKVANMPRVNPAGVHESVYFKRISPQAADLGLPPISIDKRFYPTFVDSGAVRKFLVPIVPAFHNRLFPEYQYAREQRYLTDYYFSPYGNAIKKAYLSNSRIKKLKPGDLLFFYRSKDEKSVGCLGFVEAVLVSTDATEIQTFVGNRTVYSAAEISEMARKPVLAILFRYLLSFKKRPTSAQLIASGVITAPPQSIIEIDNNRYAELKRECGLDGSIAVS